MNPLSAIFASGVALRNALYDRGALKVQRLTRPVVSVGNISVGGSGKTPFVIALGELLKERGIAFDVLSRGYGRDSAETAVVDPRGSPAYFGDEPLLIARKLQAPVIVGPDRYRAGLLAEKKFDVKLHILDDGFQHRRLHRDFDIVLVPASDLDDTLLPVGRLREPISSLRRANAVVYDMESAEPELQSRRGAADSLERVERVMGFEENPEAPLVMVNAETWKIKRRTYVDEAPIKPLAFCGIARPQKFFTQLRDLGLHLAETVAFPDHHRYTESNVHRLLRLKSSTGAGGFITTEKDAVNLGALAGGLQPLQIAQLRLILEDPENALSTMLNTLEERCGCRFPPRHEKI
jgi:tetraacyldisaccharide 4'-kinase